jgi:excisionase family DNA binding protein
VSTISPSDETSHTPVESPPSGQRLGLSVDEAASLLGVSRDLVYDLIARGELPSVRLGRRIVVPRRALEATLDSLTLQTPPEQSPPRRRP